MIIQPLTDGRLFCIRQTSHALLAGAFCRRWGNADFAPPPLLDVTLMAVNQHDSGWFEWEQAPRLNGPASNANGTPQDFMHGDEPLAKLELWRRGIERTAAQHPFAGVLVSRHAQRLNRGALDDASLGPAVHAAIRQFLADEAQRVDSAATFLQPLFVNADFSFAQAVRAGERLLAVGDSASLQITVPWSPQRTLRRCPVDGRETFTDIEMTHETGDRGGRITFNPWPFGVERFEVAIHGRVLAQQTFASEQDYHQALADAPYYEQRWAVTREQSPAGRP